ncbi:MAG: hypothetical protein ACK5MV_12835 [Aminipila sp.]
MGASIDFYRIPKEKEEVLNKYINNKEFEYLQDLMFDEWLEENSLDKELELNISYSSYGEVSSCFDGNEKVLDDDGVGVYYLLPNTKELKERFQKMHYVEIGFISFDQFFDLTSLLIMVKS